MRGGIFRSPYATSTKTILGPCTHPLPEAKVLASKKAEGSADFRPLLLSSPSAQPVLPVGQAPESPLWWPEATTELSP